MIRPSELRACTAAVLLVVTWIATPLSAQSRATSALRGTVAGSDGAPVAGAVVEVRHEGTGATKSGSSNERGQFLVLLLAPGGPYTVTVSHIGYGEERREGLVLRPGEAQPMEIVLREQPIELPGLDVEVERAVIFDVNQVGPATRLTERALESMPILSRDILDLAVLSPLVKTTEGGGFSVAGQNDRYNAILVDGLLSKDMFGLTSGGVPGAQAGARLIPLDAVSQFEILIAPFDVRLSGFTGGVMNAVTRSGSNDWRVRFGGVHRNERLIGDLSLPTGPVEASGVDRSLFAFSVGGPILRDELHFFVTGELEERTQPPTGFNLLRDDPSLIRISEENLDAVRTIFEDGFGVDVGRAGPYPLEQRLANVFARADWNFERGTRMTVRHIFSGADDDQAPNRSAFSAYELSSNAVFHSSTNNLTSVQLFTDLGSRLSNELNIMLQRTVDRTEPASELPQVEVELISSIDGAGYQRGIRLGGEFFSQVNNLEQTSLRLTNSLDVKLGEDILTLGVTGSWYDMSHAFIPGARGEYLFASLGDLERNVPERYQRTVLVEGQDEAVEFDVLEWGVFAQRQIHAGEGLTMHFGLRADMPHVLGRPERNYDLEAFHGANTSHLPSGNILLSPRWGFNWQSGGERNTQVRGGFGFFSGQLPYVWLSNAFHNNGLRLVTLSCLGRSNLVPTGTPGFDPGTPPRSCLNAPPSAPFRELRNVVVFDPGFRYPQDIKFSAVADRELTDRISGSLGLLFNKAFNQVGLRDLNLKGGGPESEDQAILAGRERRYFDSLNEDLQHVLLVTNEGEDWGASVTAELRGRLADRLDFQAGYTLARSFDRMSLVFNDMVSNLGLNPTSTDVNKPPLRTSVFDRPHKLVVTLFGAPFPGLPDTELSVLYTGQSGPPFSFVYRGDVNGDGFPGLGASFDRNNDLIYLPQGLPESLDLTLAPMSLTTRALFETAMEEYDCLREFRGRILTRNACRSPWENRLDVRAAHTVRIGGADVRFEADLINVLNLLNSEWGRVERTHQSVVPLLELCQVACETRRFPFATTWGGGVLPRRDEEGRLRPSDPWAPVTPDSQWQMQIGARVTFGEGRR